MSFSTDYYKADKLITPQCYNCKFFSTSSLKFICKNDNSIINKNKLLGEEICKNKEI